MFPRTEDHELCGWYCPTSMFAGKDTQWHEWESGHKRGDGDFTRHMLLRLGLKNSQTHLELQNDGVERVMKERPEGRIAAIAPNHAFSYHDDRLSCRVEI
jgi:hypothetical protein